jgi:integrase
LKDVVPHQLRHTYATALEMSDVPFDASFGTVRDQGAAREIGHDAVGVGA